MLISAQDFHHIVDNVCISILEFNASLAPAAGAWPTLADGLGGYIHIEGAWEGAVALWCPWTLLHQVASHMFGCETTSDEDQRDALCEMANMIGGSVKALLPEPCTLSLPNTTTDLDAIRRDGAWQEVQQFICTCKGHHFSVALWQPQSQTYIEGAR